VSPAAIAISLFVCLAAAYAQTGPVVARATSVSGPSLIYNGGDRVVIDLSDGSMVMVQPESVIVLKDFQQASSLRELFEITLGMFRVRINHFGGAAATPISVSAGASHRPSSCSTCSRPTTAPARPPTL
jgi:hypothetical protein